MENRQDRMPPKHARTSGAHDHFDAFALPGGVAMDWALNTGGLVHAKGAAIQPAVGVAEQLLAFRAQSFLRTMQTPAIAGNHGGNGPALSLQSGTVPEHSNGRAESATSSHFRNVDSKQVHH